MKISSIPRNKKRHLLISIIAPKKEIWEASAAIDRKQITISKWKYKEIKLIKRIPYKKIIKLSNKFPFLLLIYFLLRIFLSHSSYFYMAR
jgi:hypothetical protein